MLNFFGGCLEVMKHETGTRAEKFVVRFPKGVRGRIAEAARSSHRSMNAEIIARLVLSLDSWPEQLPPPRAAIPAGEEESTLLEYFRQLPQEKKTALLTLLQDG